MCQNGKAEKNLLFRIMPGSLQNVRERDKKMRDDLTPVERKKAIREGRDVDRLPNLFTFEGAEAKAVGEKAGVFFSDPSVTAAATKAVYERYEPDVVEIPGAPEGAIFGLESVIPEDSNVYIKAPVNPTREQIAAAGLGDAKTNPALQGFWGGLEAFGNDYGSRGVEIGILGAGPFSTAAQIVGVDSFLKKLVRDPEYVHLLLGKVTEMRVSFIQATAGLGVFFDIKDPVSSGSLISQKQYREFAKPYQTRIFKAMQEANPIQDHILHICGDTSKIWEDMVDTGADIISIDNAMDLAEAKRRVGHIASISGNIHPTQTMLLGTPDDVERNYKECLRKAWDAKKTYVPDYGCGLPIGTPLENLDRLFEVHRKYSSFPIDPERLS